jgi:hypothetical protein
VYSPNRLTEHVVLSHRRCASDVQHGKDLEMSIPLSQMFLPACDWTIDRNDLSQLDTTTTATLMFAQDLPSSMAMSTTMGMIYQTLVLENSAYIDRVLCSTSPIAATTNIVVSIRDERAFRQSSNWPAGPTVLIIHSKTCNSGAERGVFLTKETAHDAESLAVRFEAIAVTRKDVASTMAIDYLEIDA